MHGKTAQYYFLGNYSASSGGMKLGRSLLNNVYIVSEVKASCLQATI